jgi:hypothetical protein
MITDYYKLRILTNKLNLALSDDDSNTTNLDIDFDANPPQTLINELCEKMIVEVN